MNRAANNESLYDDKTYCYSNRMYYLNRTWVAKGAIETNASGSTNEESSNGDNKSYYQKRTWVAKATSGTNASRD